MPAPYRNTFSVKFKFPGDGVWIDATPRTQFSGFTRSKSLWNNMTPTVNTCDFKMKYDATLGAKFLVAYDDVEVDITYKAWNTSDPLTSYFKGWVQSDFKMTSATRADWMTVSCVDRSIALKKKPILAEVWFDQKLFDAATPLSSLVHRLVYASGLTDVYNFFPVGVSEVFPAFKVDTGKTYFEILQNLLVVYHCTFYFDDDGFFHIYDLYPATTSPAITAGFPGYPGTRNFDNTNIAGKLEFSKKRPKYDCARVIYQTISALKTQTWAQVVSGTNGVPITLGIKGQVGDYYPNKLGGSDGKTPIAGDGGILSMNYGSTEGTVFAIRNLSATGLVYDHGATNTVFADAAPIGTASMTFNREPGYDYSGDVTGPAVNAIDGNMYSYTKWMGRQPYFNTNYWILDFPYAITLTGIRLIGSVSGFNGGGYEYLNCNFYVVYGGTDHLIFTLPWAWGGGGVWGDTTWQAPAGGWVNVTRIWMSVVTRGNIYGYSRQGRWLTIVELQANTNLYKGEVIVDEWTNRYTYVDVKLHNESTSHTNKITKIDAVGDGYILSAKNQCVSIGGTGKNECKLESDYAYNRTTANLQTIANMLKDYYIDSAFTYSFGSFQKYEPGDFVQLSDTNYPIVNKRCVIASRKDTEATGYYEYVCEGVAVRN